jgi:Ca-activated chloride channel family protein
VGLLAFAGRSYVLTPITVDGGALDLFLDNLDPSVVGRQAARSRRPSRRVRVFSRSRRAARIARSSS